MKYLCDLCRKPFPREPGVRYAARKCAFHVGRFTHNNWMCGTMLALRDLVEPTAIGGDDSYLGSIYVPETNQHPGGFLILQWYKRRGGTDQALWLVPDEAPVPLTQELAVNALESLANEQRRSA